MLLHFRELNPKQRLMTFFVTKMFEWNSVLQSRSSPTTMGMPSFRPSSMGMLRCISICRWKDKQCGNHVEVWDELQDEWCTAYEKFDVDMCWSMFASTMFRFWNGHTDFKRVPGLGVKMHWENQQQAIFHRKLITQSSEAQEHEEIREALLELGQPSLDKLQAWKQRMQQPSDKSQESKWIGDVCKWVRAPTRKPPPFIKANDGWTKTPQETVDVIRDFFATVYQHDDQMSWDVGNANHEVPADMWRSSGTGKASPRQG